jgi:hypothetical protein
MVNGKTPLYLSVLATCVFAAGVLVLQPYSVTSPWSAYTTPVRRYFRAALARDSLALVRQSAGAGPVAWALAAARAHPDSVAVWARDARAWGGERRADTAEVFVSLPTAPCNMVVRFVGGADHARVVQATSTCWDSREGPD